MTPPEAIRMFCYTVGVPAAAYIAIYLYRDGAKVWAYIFAAQAGLWLWYMAEITMIGMGMNTRDYRIIGTPMIVVIATAMLIVVRNLRGGGHLPRFVSSHSKKPSADEDAGAGWTPAQPRPESD